MTRIFLFDIVGVPVCGKAWILANLRAMAANWLKSRLLNHEKYLTDMLHDETIIWRSPKGEIIACVEKNKVLRENLEEIRQVCQDALEDAVLMGCDEQQFRIVLSELIDGLNNSFSPQD